MRKIQDGKNIEKIIKICFCVIVIVIISGIGLLTLMNNNKRSVKEGRILSQFPKVTVKNLMTDEFYTNYTNAFADQLEFRETFIKLYYLLNFQRYTGDVVKGEEDQLFLSPLIIQNKEKYIENLKKTVTNDINTIAEQVVEAGSKFLFISVPRKDVIMDKYLPDSYISGTKEYLEYVDVIEENKSDELLFIDAYKLFKEKQNEYYDVFYQTDHHMNIRGAYYIFKELISIINKDGNNILLGALEDEYEVQSRVINGSFNRKIGQSVVGKNEELVLIPKNTTLNFTRYDNGKQVQTAIFGDGNTYAAAYMGDDYAETVVDTSNDNAPNILFVGSSYTNILESLSVYKFNKMVSIDYRHNTSGKSISDYVKEYDIDYTVYMCAQSTNSLAISSIKEHLGIKK